MYSTCKIKNLTGSVTTLHGHEFAVDEVYTIQDSVRVSWATDDDVIEELVHTNFEIHDESGTVSGLSNQIDWLKNYMPSHVNIDSQPPFAEPTHRTKFTAAASIATVAADDTEHIDYQVTAERHVYGGSLIVKNAEVGDAISACIYDKDSVIPSAYRSALCEDWPTVATYIEKHFVPANGTCNTYDEICTYPLNAKITAGLYMRITYTSTSEGSARKVGVNYKMVKEL